MAWLTALRNLPGILWLLKWAARKIDAGLAWLKEQKVRADERRSIELQTRRDASVATMRADEIRDEVDQLGSNDLDLEYQRWLQQQPVPEGGAGGGDRGQLLHPLQANPPEPAKLVGGGGQAPDRGGKQNLGGSLQMTTSARFRRQGKKPSAFSGARGWLVGFVMVMGICAVLVIGFLLGMALLSGAAQAETASWYGAAHAGRLTASGEVFNPNAATCASRTLPFGTVLRLRRHGRVAYCRVTDRGPAAWTGRQLDLSRAVFARLARLDRGEINVTVERLQ